MRSIDADALEKRIVDEENEIITDNAHAIGMHNGLTLAQAMIINAPTIDAVPVVRCEVCKHWCRNAGIADSPNGHCFCHDIETNGQDFCSYGERRSDA